MCDDDPSLATPPVPAEVPKVVAPWVLEQQAAMASAPVLEPAGSMAASDPAFAPGPAPAMRVAGAPPAGWYPDPDGRSSQRYWDGSAWTAYAPTGTRHRVLPRLRSFKGSYDLHVFGDRIVLDPVKGPDPELLGAIVGFFALCGLLGAVIGGLVGRLIAKNGNESRVARTSWTSAEDLAAAGAEVIPHDAIASLEARHHGSGGRLRLTLADGGAVRKLSWAKSFVKDLDVDGILHDASPTRSVVHGITPGRVVGRIAVYALLVLVGLGLVASVIFAVGSSSDGNAAAPHAATVSAPPRPAARAPLARACSSWIALSQRETALSADELHATVKAIRPDLEAAAAADASLEPAANAIAFLDSYLTIPSTDLQPRVAPAAADINTACSRSS